ncbi:hypothetical protein [Thalassomonas sp. RHCl1]|uniref:hypothetical protein n=1 Tax=Thalassomonas sp. RHCl1 TaxID=2995320 RepID=UPI00248AF8EA|nr:hypothetical protein [Thalassomonas sp. RHCl1]
MTRFEEISQLLNHKAYLLDGSEEEMPSYGEMPDIDSIERAIKLAQQLLDTCSEKQADEIKTLIKNRLWQALSDEVSVSDQELEEHGFDEYDWESRDWLYREVDDISKFAIEQLTSPWLATEAQPVLLEIIQKSPSIDARYFAAKQLEDLESIAVHGDIMQVLLDCFKDYDADDRPCGREEIFYDILTRILTERLMWDEAVIDLLKRTKQFQTLNNYTDHNDKTLYWYIKNYRATTDQAVQLQLLEALACQWKEKGGLFPFLEQLTGSKLSADARAQVMKILFLNFPYHAFTIEKMRSYLDTQAEHCTLWHHDQQSILDSYSDNDLPQKRAMLEYSISERIGDIHRSIEIYTRSYGMTASTFAFFVNTLEAVKEGHKTGLLNLFLRNFPDCPQTREIRKKYQRLM